MPLAYKITPPLDYKSEYIVPRLLREHCPLVIRVHCPSDIECIVFRLLSTYSLGYLVYIVTQL